MEDNDYLGDLTNSATGTNYQQGVDFDLDEYNGRWCVTPEFPSGTYAYFVAIDSNGTPVFPYDIGRAFYGNPVGGAVSTITETVVTNFLGGHKFDFNAQPARREQRNGHFELECDRRRQLSSRGNDKFGKFVRLDGSGIRRFAKSNYRQLHKHDFARPKILSCRQDERRGF